jgi:outer membrane protein assembly factor BamB
MLKRLVAILAAGFLVGAAAAVFLVGRGHERRPATTAAPHRHSVTRARPSSNLSWPEYGYDLARTHAAPRLGLRPPYRQLWKVHGDWSLIEFPPVLENGRLFFGTNHGLVLAVEAATGRIAWKRQFAGCVAASPAVGNGVVYLGFMDPPPCRGTAKSFLAALDARTGRTLWRFRAGVVETPPLLAGGRIYFGSWDQRVYAVDANTGRLAWSFATGDRVKGGVAFAGGTVFAGSYDGRLYALHARTGRLRWAAGEGGLGGLYATPSVAHGRVFIGSTNGRVYAFAASSGRLLWSRRTGSFVYSPVALSGGSAYVGSYDHRFYALSQATGAVRWSFDAGAPISGAPTVLDGLVYFSTCGSCSSYESNARHRRTFAVDARTGRLVWRFSDGEYSPVIADRKRVYLTGYTHLYGLVPR